MLDKFVNLCYYNNDIFVHGGTLSDFHPSKEGINGYRKDDD